MTNEIIQNYPITPEMLEPIRSRHRWNFADFKIGTAMRLSDMEAWKRAAQAARQTASRKGYRFSIKWSDESEAGIIVRVQ